MESSYAVLIAGTVLVAVGSFLTGLVVGQMSKRGRRKGRHAKGSGRHAR